MIHLFNVYYSALLPRSIFVSELLDNELWWKGPSWLSDDIGGQSNDVKAGLANIVLKSVSKEIRVSAYILKQLTTSVPSKTLQHPKNLERYKLADPDYQYSQPVDMIIGVDVFEEIIENEREEVSPGIFLRKTIFGWIVLGKHDDTVGEAFHCHLSIDDTLRRY